MSHDPSETCSFVSLLIKNILEKVDIANRIYDPLYFFSWLRIYNTTFCQKKKISH